MVPQAEPYRPQVEPYRPRPIRFLELYEAAGWRLKLYGICYDAPLPRPGLIASMKRLAIGRLPYPASEGDRYGVGFAGVHQGRAATYVFADWWAEENEIRHFSFHAPPGEDLDFEECMCAHLCIWDLRVLEFEREAWLATVLRNPDGPDLDAYLARRFDAEV